MFSSLGRLGRKGGPFDTFVVGLGLGDDQLILQGAQQLEVALVPKGTEFMGSARRLAYTA